MVNHAGGFQETPDGEFISGRIGFMEKWSPFLHFLI